MTATRALTVIMVAALVAAQVLTGGFQKLDRGFNQPTVSHHETKSLHKPKIANPVTAAFVGDSITTLEYLGVARGELSWVNWAAGDAVQFTSGWAYSGMRTDQMAAGVSTYAVDVLAIMAGTNDLLQGRGADSAIPYLDLIVARAGVSSVVVSAIAPNDRHPGASLAYNVALQSHVESMGWTFVDPWTAVRNPDGSWVAGAAYDENHPNGATQSVTGAILRDAIVKLVHNRLT